MREWLARPPAANPGSNNLTSLSLSPRPTSALFPPPPPPPSLLYSTLLQSRPFLSGLYLVPLVKMGAIPEADPDEPQETKPFKFVTGELSSLTPTHPCGSMGLGIDSIADFIVAGMFVLDSSSI